MTIQEITDRNYAATVRRGQITRNTIADDLVKKIDEENVELWGSVISDTLFDPSELADVALVCFAMAKHFDIDLIEAMKEKMLYNETRID